MSLTPEALSGALRAADAANIEKDIATTLEGEVKAAPAPTKQEEQKLPPRNARFNDFTQALAGKLMAEEEALNRARSDIQGQIAAALDEHDRTLAEARTAYDAAVLTANNAHNEKRAQLAEREADAQLAHDGINAALAALTGKSG